MPKKTTRTNKTTQQRAKEEQWRRRMASQAQSVAGVTYAPDPETEVPEDMTDFAGNEIPAPAVAPRMPAAAPRGAAATQARTMNGQSRAAGVSAAPRRAGVSAAGRASRLRLAPSALSLDDEMSYIRDDIRRLVLLTAVCIALLIVLTLVFR